MSAAAIPVPRGTVWPERPCHPIYFNSQNAPNARRTIDARN
jgi:hypothetical protein